MTDDIFDAIRRQLLAFVEHIDHDRVRPRFLEDALEAMFMQVIKPDHPRYLVPSADPEIRASKLPRKQCYEPVAASTTARRLGQAPSESGRRGSNPRLHLLIEPKRPAVRPAKNHSGPISNLPLLRVDKGKGAVCPRPSRIETNELARGRHDPRLPHDGRALVMSKKNHTVNHGPVCPMSSVHGGQTCPSHLLVKGLLCLTSKKRRT